MNYVILFFLVGAMISVITAIVQSVTREKKSSELKGDLFSSSTMLGAYILIALAWPLSVAVFLYAVIGGIVARGES